jgi:F-box/leucine-rich repeat protein 2/20
MNSCIDSAFIYLLQCIKFKHLNLELCSTLSDISLAQVANLVGSQLQSLRVSACIKISNDGIQDVLLSCSQFESLTLGGSRAFTSQCFRFKTKLPHFKAIHFETGLRSISDHALFCIGEFARDSLEEVSLSLSESMSMDGVRFLMQSCPKLKTLSISTEDYR